MGKRYNVHSDIETERQEKRKKNTAERRKDIDQFNN